MTCMRTGVCGGLQVVYSKEDTLQTQRRTWISVQQYNVVNFVVIVCLLLVFGLGIVGGTPRAQLDLAHASMPRESVVARSACAWNDRVHTVIGNDQVASIAAYYGITVNHLTAYNHLTSSDAFFVNQRICIPGGEPQQLFETDSGGNTNVDASSRAAYRALPVRLAAPVALVRDLSASVERREKPAAPKFQPVPADITETVDEALQRAPVGFLLHGALAMAAGAYNAFPFGQCTWWATQRYYQLHNVFVPWSLNANAGEWVDRANDYGWHVSSVPKIGSILVLQDGVQGATDVGHVGIVEQVNDDGSVIASSMNWGDHPDAVTNSLFLTGSGVSFISQ